MKQSLASPKFPPLFVVLSAVFVFWLTGCGHLPQTHSPEEITRGEAATSATKPAAIDLNTASAAELERLPGVGPMLAERIITYRQENGRFRRVEHLMMVRGISDRKFRGLRSLVRVE